MGSISKLPNQCEIFQYFFGHFENCPINVQNYPINVKCLRTPPVQAFHIDWVVLKFLAIFWHFLKNYPINVKCLHRGGAQAFHIDWVKLDLLGITHWLGRISKLPNQCEKFQKYLRNFKTAQSMYGNYPINVKCLQQAFHIDWVVYLKNLLPISKLPNQCMKTSQSMWNACSKHFTSVDDRNRKIPKQPKPKFRFSLLKQNLALFKYAICCLFSKNIMIKSILQIVVCLVA